MLNIYQGKMWLKALAFTIATTMAASAQTALAPLTLNPAPKCATDYYLQEAMKDPKIAARVASLEALTKAAQLNKTVDSTTLLIIPVVFHVVHQGGPENVSFAQIQGTLNELNLNYRKKASDTTLVNAAFKSRHKDMRVEFRLATIDPNGNCTDGVTRDYSPSLTNNATSASKTINYWNPAKYFNVWIVKSIGFPTGGSFILGFATFPGTASSQNPDGVIMIADCVGDASSNPDLSYRRTLTHEAGHYLNLRHTWGNNFAVEDPNACNDPEGDLVDDTPQTIGIQSSCPGSYSPCSVLANVQNHMDYSSCPRNFTRGQRDRARTALFNASSRTTLWSVGNLLATGVSAGSFAVGNCAPILTYIPRPPINICTSGTATLSASSYNSQTPVTYTWQFVGSALPTYTGATVNPTFNTPGFKDATVIASNAFGSDTLVLPSQVLVVDAAPRQMVTTSNYYYENFQANRHGSIPNIFSTGAPDSVLKTYSTSTGTQIWKRVVGPGWGRTDSTGLWISNRGNQIGSLSSIYFPIVDVSTLPFSAYLSFDLAWQPRTTTNTDALAVQSSKDCGATWSTRFTWTNSNGTLNTEPNNALNPSAGVLWKPLASVWRTNSININTFLNAANGTNVMFRLVWTSGGGNNPYIDNLAISNSITSVPNAVANSIFNFSLFPNPSGSGITNVSYTIAKDMPTSITLSDVLGKTMIIKAAGSDTEGDHNLILDHAKLNLAPGIYTLRLTAGSVAKTTKLVVQ